MKATPFLKHHIPTRGIEIVIIFISFLSGNEAKRVVEFRHSTRYASEIRRKVGTEVSYWERSVLTLDSQVPSAYPATGG